MSYLMVDIESDGPCPHLYSMISLGLVKVSTGESFYGRFKPISDAWVPEALAVSGHSREETLNFPDPEVEMKRALTWLKETFEEREFRGRKQLNCRFISDNNGFDWQFWNYYAWRFLGTNPLGHSSANLGSLYKGLVKDDFKNFKHLRKTRHTHHPVDDARGNVEAMVHMKREMGLKIKL